MVDAFEVTCDLFSLPYKEGARILYAPRLGFICAASQGLTDLLAELEHIDVQTLTPQQREVLDYLDQKGILNGSRELSLVRENPSHYAPTMVTLFPTNQCNLRCRYCYASAGEDPPKFMDWHYAVSAVNQVIDNLKREEKTHMPLGFHGGGEPLLPWRFIQRIVSYTEERCADEGLTLSVFSATNGLLSEHQLKWIVKHFQSLNISFDGLPHIQDLHRPLEGGKGSFDFVDRTMRFLDAHNFRYGIRSTVSSRNIDLMEQSIDFIAEHYKTKQVHFEPLFFCGRCKTNANLNPSFDTYARNFKACATRAQSHGIALTYSGCRIEALTDTFCGVSRDNFSVTPDGFITSCYEVTNQDDPKAETFFIGRIADTGDLEIDPQKRAFLHSLSVHNLDYCRDCFAKWHCAGECAAKLGHTDYQGPRGHDRCKLNRELITERIEGLLEGRYGRQIERKPGTDDTGVEEPESEA